MPGLSPSTSQPDLAVPNEPTSEMVKEKRTVDEHATLDSAINASKLAKLDLEDPVYREAALPGLLIQIAEQNNYTIDIAEVSKIIIQHRDWLTEFLVKGWRAGSFKKVRRLSERPLCTLVDKFT